MVKSKHILIGAGAVALALGVPYLLKVKRLTEELTTVTKVSVYKVRLDGIELEVKVTVKNPTGGSIRLKVPFVKMMYGEKTFATSQVSDQEIEIGKFTDVTFPSIFINLPFMSLATTVPNMLKEFRSTGKINMTIQTITTINGNVPYTKTDQVVIGS